MSTTPKVSVVLPAYNCEKYIQKAIDSVIEQTYTNWELLIIDDCSTDQTLEIAKQAEVSDARIKVIKQTCNGGVAKARNAGIDYAQGEWIALLDADDYWVKDKLMLQLECTKEYHADIVYCSYGFVDEDGKEYGSFIVPEKTDFEATLVKSVISCSTCFIKTELFKRNKFSSEFYHEDLHLWLKMLQQGAIARGVTEILAYYRQVKGSRSNNKIRSAVERWKIFRKAFQLPFFYCCKIFCQYAFGGINKYVMRKKS